MKIAVIAPSHIPARRANTLQVMKMTQAIAVFGHSVNLIVPGLPIAGEESCQWDDLAQMYGLRHSFPVEWLPTSLDLRRYDFGWQAVRKAHQWGANLVYTRLPQAAVMAGRRGISTVYELHDLPQGVMGRQLFRMFLHTPGACRLITISKPLSEDLTNIFGAWGDRPDMLIAPDGVDLERYANLPDEAKARKLIASRIASISKNIGVTFDPELFTAGYTGHLYKGRGLDLILQLAPHFPNVNFLLIGGEEKDVEALRKEINSLKLTNIIITGFIPNAELPLYQSACEVLLMPYQSQVSASSGGDIARYLSPMKMFEYLATGRVIFSSDLPVLGEILSDENAVILPQNNIQSWIDALRAIQDNPERRHLLGQHAKATAQDYSWERRAERILAGLA